MWGGGDFQASLRPLTISPFSLQPRRRQPQRDPQPGRRHGVLGADQDGDGGERAAGGHGAAGGEGHAVHHQPPPAPLLLPRGGRPARHRGALAAHPQRGRGGEEVGAPPLPAPRPPWWRHPTSAGGEIPLPLPSQRLRPPNLVPPLPHGPRWGCLQRRALTSSSPPCLRVQNLGWYQPPRTNGSPRDTRFGF